MARLRQLLLEQHERAHLEGAARRHGAALVRVPALFRALDQPRQRAVPQLRRPTELAIW